MEALDTKTAENTDGAQADNRKLTLAVVSVFILASIIRFVGWDQKEFWLDEVYRTLHTAGNTYATIKTNLVYSGEAFRNLLVPPADLTVMQVVDATRKDGPQYQPLYYVLAFLWQKLISPLPQNLRLLSVLVSCAQAPSMYFLARVIFRERATALIAAILTACSPFCLLYAQDVSEYALLFSSLCLTISFLVLYLRDLKKKNLLFFALSGIFSCLLSPHTPLMLTGLYAYSVWRLHRNIKALVSLSLVNCIFALVMVPWCINMYEGWKQFSITQKWLTLAVPTRELARFWFGNLAQIFFDTGYNDPFGKFSPILVKAASTICLFAQTFCLISFLRQSSKIKILLLLMVLGHLAFFCGQDLFLGGIRSMAARYMIPLVIAIILVVSSELRHLRRKHSSKMKFVAVGASIFLLLEMVSIGVYWSQTTWNNKTIKEQSLMKTAAVLDAKQDPALLITDWSEGTNILQMIGISNYARTNNTYLLVDDAKPLAEFIKPRSRAYLFNVSYDFYKDTRKTFPLGAVKGLNYLTDVKTPD